MSTTKPRPPKRLGPAGRRFWRDVMADFQLAGPHESALLEQACRELDIIDRLDDALTDAEVEVNTPAHGLVVNRLFAEVQQHRGAFRMLIRDLRLPAEPGQGTGAGKVVSLQASRSPRRTHRAAGLWPSAGLGMTPTCRGG